MAKILFLAHRIPYPPNKGDKIRSWNILKFLAERHEVHLGTFIDDAEDWQHVPFLKDLCADVFCVGLNPLMARLKSLPSLLTGAPLSLGFYRSAKMQHWVDSKLSEVDRVFLFSSPMAQFMQGKEASGMHTVMDFVDIDSDKWAQYAKNHGQPMRWVYAREAKTLATYERKVAGSVAASLFVSDQEAALFREMTPLQADKIHGLNNGVDHAYFTPDQAYETPFEGPVADQAPRLVFTGAMDYWANAEAVIWFAQDIFPLIREKQPEATFHIVGGKPTTAVRALSEMPGITVTGRVPDVRPYIAHATAVVAPLRIARGVQNKVLEGMAMARPVIATPQAAEGIECLADKEIWIADGARNFADRCSCLGELGHVQSWFFHSGGDHLAGLDETRRTAQDSAQNQYIWACHHGCQRHSLAGG